MGLRLKNLKNLNFRGGEEFMENQYIGGLPKKGACTVCRLKRELGEKELGGVFEAEKVEKKKKIKGSIQKPDSPHIICLP